MNSLTCRQGKWNPFKEMDELQKRMFSIMNRDCAGQPERSGSPDEPITWPEWAPVVDIVEDDKQYVIKAELPGVTKEDLKVTVEAGILTLHGERKFESEAKDKRYHRVERSYGSFTRRFNVPDDADPEKVGAEFKDGVLHVSLQKDEKAKPRSVEVKVG